MSGVWTTLPIVDGRGIIRNVRFFDESATGAGPFSWGYSLTDQLGGTIVPAQESGGNLDAILIALQDLLAGGAVIGATRDAGPNWTTLYGTDGAGTPFHSSNQSGSAAVVSGPPISGDKLVIDDIIFSVSSDMNVTFTCEGSGSLVYPIFYCTARSGPMQITTRGRGPKLDTPDGRLKVQTSASGDITVLVGYHSEP